MSHHTPGPWVVEYDEPYCADLVQSDGSRVRGIKLWLDDACFDANPEMEANHRLAVSAPSLLELLEDAVCLMQIIDPVTQEWFYTASAAVTKARGIK